ncbi:Exodeoxyribonuclease I subunit D [Desulfonispora thiosulfatigenes DSM 11270]|uniref:Nuclease SbcCD subunit D n=1 Tax=Desulfonispora thiosulfatigenes DSM 11270 TaxID=656914 RepID=A0A1W1ULA9_DESTI|nr:exonuclease SbcCD subunit D [Desulfonispora thiosulfatigenes]SMB81852.1 Exodeoxyribonuclease I subunit D [Desulfonispora thiosulfatigenes DSM 11270]
MKIIHTGDWHIGKIVHSIHMTEDQRYILKQFIELVAKEKPDVVIIAGDLYDRSVPPVEAVELLDEVLSEILLDLNTPIMIVAGNHDSSDRLSFGSKILKDKGLYISGNLPHEFKPIVINDQRGPVNFYLVPYANPVIVRALYNDEKIINHDTAMKAIIEKIKENININERNVLITHAFVIGEQSVDTCESERPLSIGGTDYVDANHFNLFNYTALGHLHRPQKVGSEKIRYAGSLLKYSFSEHMQKKSISIIKMDGEGEIKVNQVELNPLRDMRKIKGKLENLLDADIYKDTNINDYLMVTIEDEGEIMDIMGKLRTVYPNVLSIEKISFAKDGVKVALGKDFAKKDTLELFSDFYCSLTGKEFTKEKKDILINVLKEINNEGR